MYEFEANSYDDIIGNDALFDKMYTQYEDGEREFRLVLPLDEYSEEREKDALDSLQGYFSHRHDEFVEQLENESSFGKHTRYVKTVFTASNSNKGAKKVRSGLIGLATTIPMTFGMILLSPLSTPVCAGLGLVGGGLSTRAVYRGYKDIMNYDGDILEHLDELSHIQPEFMYSSSE